MLGNWDARKYVLPKENVFKMSILEGFMNKWIELLLGIILIAAPVMVAFAFSASWGLATLTFLMGGLVVFVFLIGIMFVMLGISDFSA